jgi:hypothetical protein
MLGEKADFLLAEAADPEYGNVLWCWLPDGLVRANRKHGIIGKTFSEEKETLIINPTASDLYNHRYDLIYLLPHDNLY